MTWRIEFERVAESDLDALDPPVRARITQRLTVLAADPFRTGNVIALTGGGYRLRVGDWRVVFDLIEAEHLIVVVRVRHRREVYRL